MWPDDASRSGGGVACAAAETEARPPSRDTVPVVQESHHGHYTEGGRSGTASYHRARTVAGEYARQSRRAGLASSGRQCVHAVRELQALPLADLWPALSRSAQTL